MPNNYVVSYDLRKPNYTEEDYEKMYAVLDSWEAKHVQDSVWAIVTEADAGQIFDGLWRHMHQSKDRLLVLKMDGGYHIHSLSEAPWG